MAASCLLPIAGNLVKQLPEELSRVLDVLWSCLSEMKDDLSSSVGVVMDLIGSYLFLFPTPRGLNVLIYCRRKTRWI